ncbi:PadR family transcriptional regulator [Pseudolysinimonas kribbensis]|uniref:Transcriptional regulator n=1 Tax=Pseudolysinimonas kribbensis TaxID=433641 RepID=A0ABQ6KDW7_9MICO|nr:PadR family transcriptional regulator [Pseudolysinimonas kribbensis]GMA96677.1 transcriptional regulator [Pseudolysinimonas kribbensis]
MRTSSAGFDLPGFDLHAAVDGLREAFAPREAGRDIRAAILTELLAEPMHGYQLIQAIQARSGGAWTPTPGTVYPTLQLLADEGLVTATQTGERKVYALTDAGREQATVASAESSGPRRRFDPERDLALPKAGAKLAQAMSGFGPSASSEQTERAVAIIDEARRKLYAILAED